MLAESQSLSAYSAYENQAHKFDNSLKLIVSAKRFVKSFHKYIQLACL